MTRHIPLQGHPLVRIFHYRVHAVFWATSAPFDLWPNLTMSPGSKFCLFQLDLSLCTCKFSTQETEAGESPPLTPAWL